VVVAVAVDLQVSRAPNQITPRIAPTVANPILRRCSTGAHPRPAIRHIAARGRGVGNGPGRRGSDERRRWRLLADGGGRRGRGLAKENHVEEHRETRWR
jgi:hypothetical protein